jgi:hypothetical protein
MGSHACCAPEKPRRGTCPPPLLLPPLVVVVVGVVGLVVGVAEACGGVGSRPNQQQAGSL